MLSSTEALQQLRAGNERFAAGEGGQAALGTHGKLASVVDGQQPFAIVLGCADSRVPVELVFDQELGDLFVVRVAGNIATPAQIGSIEFAAHKFGTRLIVVLGHSGCGAIEATLDAVQQPSEGASPHLAAIVEQIRPAIEETLRQHGDGQRDELLAAAVRENVRQTAARLLDESAVIKNLLEHDGLEIVGAEYSLQTGVVEFL